MPFMFMQKITCFSSNFPRKMAREGAPELGEPRPNAYVPTKT